MCKPTLLLPRGQLCAGQTDMRAEQTCSPDIWSTITLFRYKNSLSLLLKQNSHSVYRMFKQDAGPRQARGEKNLQTLISLRLSGSCVIYQTLPCEEQINRDGNVVDKSHCQAGVCVVCVCVWGGGITHCNGGLIAIHPSIHAAKPFQINEEMTYTNK